MNIFFLLKKKKKLLMWRWECIKIEKLVVFHFWRMILALPKLTTAPLKRSAKINTYLEFEEYQYQFSFIFLVLEYLTPSPTTHVE